MFKKKLIKKLKNHIGSRPVKKVILNSKDILSLDGLINLDLIVNVEKINNIRYINKFHEKVNLTLNDNGIYVSCAETLVERRYKILKRIPYGFQTLFLFFDFIWKRLIPKISFVNKIYFFITNGHNRVKSKAEILGRLISCGFEIKEYFEHENLLYIIAKKVSKPDYNMKPSYGLLFTMKRVGYKGKIIEVYKFRTMHPYSEYCQELIVKENSLSKDGKIENDYRVTSWGKFFRKYWIDELPMILNILKGELDIVGVRPLSKHYYSLYPKDLQELRTKVKPGLIPPYYADLPKSFDAILVSEKQYISKKLRKPFLTDVKYFYKAFVNIVFKGARSK